MQKSGGNMERLDPECAWRYTARRALLLHRAYRNIAFLCGLGQILSPMTVQLYLPGTMITSLASYNPNLMCSGRSNLALRWKTGPAIHLPHLSKLSPSRGRRGRRPTDDPRVGAIAQAAKELVEMRDRWLTPTLPPPNSA